MKRLLLRLCLFLSLALSLTGCIDDDISNCPVGIRVYFTYETTYAGTDIDPSAIERMNLYVFDAGGILRAVVQDSDPDISADYYMTVPSLSAGNYRFAAWGNLYGCFSTVPAVFTVGQTTFEEARLAFAHTDEAPVISQPLFFAHLPAAKVTTEREQRFYLPLEQTVNTVNLTTEGLPVNENSYRLRIKDNNGAYTFDHSFASDSEFTYTSLCDKDAGGQPKATLTVLKLGAGRHPVIELTDMTTQTVRYTGDLVELLDARGVDYRTQHVFDIHLKFSTTSNVEVIIDGWQVTEGGFILK
ncbi:MAG: FimB/Mfa2 family fimbrial subunit [Proteiniphilum sp.]|jgi:hypothetical protein|nr:FimB/Mfa2 family fimbrial subunit [Proteiniphilum sp.]